MFGDNCRTCAAAAAVLMLLMWAAVAAAFWSCSCCWVTLATAAAWAEGRNIAVVPPVPAGPADREGQDLYHLLDGSYHVFQFLTVKQREGLRGGRRCCVRGPLGGQLVQAETAEAAEGGVLAGVRGPEAGEHGEAVVICVRGACSSGA